ncbi:GMC family oxidoreductase [Cognatishimia sp.]|uniref:GMC family oxidoreductase n=1 Tax=Cognatishimia sp. TaxID=2211648 RepID=UPI003518579F
MKDFLVIGAGSAGCIMAAELVRRGAGSVILLEAGPSDRHPLVQTPMGLIWVMGSKRDWRFTTTPQEAAGNREIKVPRGRMVGGSGSINSMAWFRGRRDDFDTWNVKGWRYEDIAPAFDAVEAALKPKRLAKPHCLTEGLSSVFANSTPTPESESSGVFAYNLVKGRRNSAARAMNIGQQVELRTGAHVDRLIWNGDKAVGAVLVDGSEIRVSKGVVLSAGSVASPGILMRSGVGPKDDLANLGIDCRVDAPDVGENLHDHPGVGLHFEGAGSGYGLEAAQWVNWALAPLKYALSRQGPFASPTVEGGMFFNARGEDQAPDVQSHFIPFHLAHKGHRFQMKSGYFADVCVCRPKSRGRLRLATKDAKAAPLIDLGLLRDPDDLDTLAAGVERLRELLKSANFGTRRAPEVFPSKAVTGDALKEHIRANCGTAYHPVGTVRLGGPISERLSVKRTQNLWVADASVMPAITSANTNAPSMMIGWKGAEFIAEDAA